METVPVRLMSERQAPAIRNSKKNGPRTRAARFVGSQSLMKPEHCCSQRRENVPNPGFCHVPKIWDTLQAEK